MRHVMTVCAFATLLAACGGSQSQIGASGAMPSLPMAAQPAATLQSPIEPFGLLPAAGLNLYVGNRSRVTAYAPGSSKLLRTMPLGSKPWVTALAFASGNLSVAVACCEVRVYVKGGPKLLRIIETVPPTPPVALAVDSAGNLFVANQYPGSVNVYAGSSGKLLRSISKGVGYPEALAFDASGNLYVADFVGSTGGPVVTVYAPNKNVPLRTIHTGNAPKALAFDGSGNLYVATDRAVEVYSKGSAKLLRKISNGVRNAYGLAFDSAGNLYVANHTKDTVTVYAKGSAKLLRTISAGVASPWTLAFDGSGNLYVANWAFDSGTITVYAPNSTKVLRTISNGVRQPQALLFGP